MTPRSHEPLVPISADTLTEEQIRALRKTLACEYRDPTHPNYDRSHGLFGPGKGIPECWDALNGHLSEAHRHRMRERIAEIINARNASGEDWDR